MSLPEAIHIDQMLERARSRLDRVMPDRLDDELTAGAIVVDVRTLEQRQEQGELPGAHVIDLTVLEWRLAPSSRWRSLDVSAEQKVIVVCSHGYSSSLAAVRLQELGLINATDLVGGFTAWKRLIRPSS